MKRLELPWRDKSILNWYGAVAQLGPAGRQGAAGSQMYVNILKSIRNNRFYVGHTNDLERRLKEHWSGGTASLKGWKPYKLVYSEKFETREEAISREKYFKSGTGREKRLGLITNFPQELVRGFNVGR